MRKKVFSLLLVLVLLSCVSPSLADGDTIMINGRFSVPIGKYDGGYNAEEQVYIIFSDTHLFFVKPMYMTDLFSVTDEEVTTLRGTVSMESFCRMFFGEGCQCYAANGCYYITVYDEEGAVEYGVITIGNQLLLISPAKACTEEELRDLMNTVIVTIL